MLKKIRNQRVERHAKMRVLCPHCDSVAICRTSEQMSELVRSSTHICCNPECGHTFVCHTEVVYTLSPSAHPRAGINLPLSRHVRRQALRAALDVAPVSEHSAGYVPGTSGDIFEDAPVRAAQTASP